MNTIDFKPDTALRHDIGRAQVIGVDVAGLWSTGRDATCSLLIHCRKEGVAIEHV